MSVSQKIAQKRNSLLFRIKLKVHSKIMEHWHKYIKVLLIVLLVEIIIVNALVINYFLSKTETISIVNAQEVGRESGMLVQADVSQKVLDSQESASTEIDVIGLIRANFPDNAEVAIRVFQAESGLKADTESWCDRTADDRSFSIGLAQINITQHKIGELDCPSSFKGANYKAIVINEKLYNECVKKAKNPEENLRVAKKIYDGRGWNSWGAYDKSMLIN